MCIWGGLTFKIEQIKKYAGSNNAKEYTNINKSAQKAMMSHFQGFPCIYKHLYIYLLV